MFGKQRILAGLCLAVLNVSFAPAADKAGEVLGRIGVKRGICVVLGEPTCELALALARNSELLVYVQLPRQEEVVRARRTVAAAGLYGTRVYVEKGAPAKLHLADNVADAVIAVGDAKNVRQEEVLRVLRPEGKAVLGGFLIGVVTSMAPCFNQLHWPQWLPTWFTGLDLSQWGYGVAYGVMILVIIFRPTGILGKSAATRA